MEFTQFFVYFPKGKFIGVPEANASLGWAQTWELSSWIMIQLDWWKIYRTPCFLNMVLLPSNIHILVMRGGLYRIYRPCYEMCFLVHLLRMHPQVLRSPILTVLYLVVKPLDKNHLCFWQTPAMFHDFAVQGWIMMIMSIQHQHLSYLMTFIRLAGDTQQPIAISKAAHSHI